MTLPLPGLFAVHDSTTYQVVAVGDDWLNLLVAPGTSLPSSIGQGEDRRGRTWVKVPKAVLERYFRVVVTVDWRGEEFGLNRVSGDEAQILGGSPSVADRLGLGGDQYNGFHATVPVQELAVVDVQEREIDV